MRKSIIAFFVSIIALVSLYCIPVRAAGNIYVCDTAMLINDEEASELMEVMQQLSEYGDVVFMTNNTEYSGSAEQYAKEIGDDIFGGNSGTILLIDLYNRRIEIYSDGGMLRKISKNYANIITDNAYPYATDGEYYECAMVCFEQMLSIASGSSVSTPMRYVSNALIAAVIAFFITFIIAFFSRNSASFGMKIRNADLSPDNEMTPDTVYIASHRMTKQTKTTHSSSGSGGGGGGHSGGGGGGHSF